MLVRSCIGIRLSVIVYWLRRYEPGCDVAFVEVTRYVDCTILEYETTRHMSPVFRAGHVKLSYLRVLFAISSLAVWDGCSTFRVIFFEFNSP